MGWKKNKAFSPYPFPKKWYNGTAGTWLSLYTSCVRLKNDKKFLVFAENLVALGFL